MGEVPTSLCCLVIILVLFSWTDKYAVCRSISTSKDSTKLSSNQQSAATSDHYTDKNYENGENYIPFQWKVEIIKREYDDYVLPDGTVYRVPHGAVPPHRHKGGPYNVPYYTFKEKGHSDKIYDKPKLVETYDTQTLELLQQRWYREQEWKRRKLGNNPLYSHRDNYDASATTNNDEESRPAASQNQFQTKTQAPSQQSDDAAQHYYMRHFDGSQRWSNLSKVPGKMVTFSQFSANGPLDSTASKTDLSQISDIAYSVGFHPDRNLDTSSGYNNGATDVL